MGLTAEKKRLIIRRVIFAVLLIFCACKNSNVLDIAFRLNFVAHFL